MSITISLQANKYIKIGYTKVFHSINKIGDNIKIALKRRNVSINELAKKINIHKYQLNSILYGRSKNLDILLQIASALNVSMDFLLGIETTSPLETFLFDSEKSYRILIILAELSITNEWKLTLADIIKVFSIIKDMESDISEEQLKLVLKGVVLSLQSKNLSS